ncbi:MAG: TM0996/MTH895 family glutaredoxin-like protein [Clostridiaceae bacterium]|nr:TM0996/MTH895 family glutaredoxin-like protein [Clostridiaceae bacterium]
MVIKVLGSGCKSCNTLEVAVKEVVEELNLSATIEKVTDLQDILNYGVMKTPALVVDEVVKVSGKVPSKKEIKKMLS